MTANLLQLILYCYLFNSGDSKVRDGADIFSISAKIALLSCEDGL